MSNLAHLKLGLCVEDVNFREKSIKFWCGPELAAEISTYGIIQHSDTGELYILVVDLRYDFNEVLSSILEYQKAIEDGKDGTEQKS